MALRGQYLPAWSHPCFDGRPPICLALLHSWARGQRDDAPLPNSVSIMRRTSRAHAPDVICM